MSKAFFNIKKVQLSPISSIDSKGTPTYGTPLALPGTVSLTLDAEGENQVTYADGVGYITTGGSTSYKGKLENYLITKEILKAIYKWFEDTAKNMIETDAQPQEFGMQFAVDNDEGQEVYFTLYRVASTKPSSNFQTKEGNATINPQSVDITITPIALADGTMVVKSFADKTSTGYANYFTKILVPTKG